MSQGLDNSASVLQDRERKKTRECCRALRCKRLDPRGSLEESNLDEFVNEMSSGFEGGNTTERSTFQECREKFLEENYPDISTGRHLHPPMFLANQEIHGFFISSTPNAGQPQRVYEPPDSLSEEEKKRWIDEKKREDLMKKIGKPPDHLSKSAAKQWISKREEEMRKSCKVNLK